MELQFELIANEYILKEWLRWNHPLSNYINHIMAVHIGYIKHTEQITTELEYRVDEVTLRPHELKGEVKVIVTNLQHRKQIDEFINRVIGLIATQDLERRVLDTLEIKFPDIHRLIKVFKIDPLAMTCTYVTTDGKSYTHTYRSLHNLDTSILVDVMTTHYF